MATTTQGESLPRWVRVFGIPLAGFVFFTLFLYLGFPFDRLGDRIADEVRDAYGIQLEFRDLNPRLYLAGPGIEANAVHAVLADGAAYDFDRVGLRPAWSLAWFRGDPAIHLDVTSAIGDATGTLVLGETSAWDGRFESVAVGRLPLANLTKLANIGGLVDAQVDIEVGEAGPEGEASFSATNGSLGIAEFPVDIPFETLEGELDFGDENFVSIRRFVFDGPMISGALSGNIVRAARFDVAPLRLEADLDVKADMRESVKSAGIRIGRDGSAKLRISGTVSQPNVR